MQNEQYVVLAQRTSAPNFFDQKVSYLVLVEVLEGFSKYGAKLDTMKKAMFYGKRPDKTDAPDIFGGKSLADRGLDFSDAEKRIIHAMIGAMTEAQELAEILLNRLVGQITEIDFAHSAEEFGDILWYIAEFAAHSGHSMTSMMQTNIDKLAVRYPEKFEAYLASNRDLDAENKVLGKVAVTR